MSDKHPQPHELFEPDDSQWEALFKQRPLGSPDFERRTLNAIRADRANRRRVRVFRSWSGAAAAGALAAAGLWLAVLPSDPANGAHAADITPEEAAIYGEFLEWEEALADADGLFDDENLETADLLFVLHAIPEDPEPY